MAHDVFISHSTSDKSVSDAVCAALENAGIRCWIAPRDVQPGRSFAGEITRAIQESKIMVLIFSAHSNNSEQVLREVQLAVNSHLHIIQFRIEDVLLNDDLKYFLSTPHWLDALTPPLENHLRKLEGAIKKLLDAATEGRATPEGPSSGWVIRAPEQRSRKAWPWVLGGAIAVLIVAGLVWKSWRLAQDRQSTPAPIASRDLATALSTPATVPNEVVVEFPDVDTSTTPGHTVAALPYLHRLEISVTDIQPATSEIVLVNNRGLYQGAAVHPTTSQNLLTQVNTGNVPASFTLKFPPSVRIVSFTRPALYPATNSGITHPAWSAHALDAEGHELSSQSEGLTRSFVDVPAVKYVLRSPGFDPIAALRFDSDPRLNGVPFAGFSAILIERLTLNYESKSSR
jgi:hypothetical protein